EGLENRIRNLRRKLADNEARTAEFGSRLPHSAIRISNSTQSRPEIPNPTVSLLAPAALDPEQREWQLRDAEEGLRLYWNVLEPLSGQLADQRLLLAEQCERLALARDSWQQEHAAKVTEINGMEQRLLEREQETENQAALVRRQQDEAGRIRRFLESWQAR